MRSHLLRSAAGYTPPAGGLTGYTFEVTTGSPDTVFTLRTTGTVNYDVDWGDGASESGITANTKAHTYATADTYTVTVESVATFRFYANNAAPDNLLITSVAGAPDAFPWNVSFANTWYGCSNLTSFPLINTSAGTNFSSTWRSSGLTSFPLVDTSAGIVFAYAWYNCTSLTSFPLINTSAGTDFSTTWRNCSSLTSFPLIDTSAGTDFNSAWYSRSSLTSFPLINTSAGRSTSAWRSCSGLTSFPLINTSAGTNFNNAWRSCSGLTSFPLINTSAGTDFTYAWRSCSGLTSFPLIDTSAGTNFSNAWYGCSSLTSFPAGFFDSWTGTPANNCFIDAWDLCSSLSATSVENILNSIDTSGQSAPASGVDITIDYDAGSGTPSISTAVANIKGRGWTITLNGVAQ